MRRLGIHLVLFVLLAGVAIGALAWLAPCRLGLDGITPSSAESDGPRDRSNNVPVDEGEATAAEPPARDGEIVNSIGMRFILIPAGEFLMGARADDQDASKDEKPQHKVRIGKPFYLGVFEVTVGQFREFVNDSGHVTSAEKRGKNGIGLDQAGLFDIGYTWRNPGLPQTDRHPIGVVSWDDAVAFCDWLSRKEGRTYRLPTEAEWEYACRAGTTAKYYWGDDAETLGQYAWHRGNSRKTTHVVGQKKPNAFGLYDMFGNVSELCEDFHSDDYYTVSPIDDPKGLPVGRVRVLRGGSAFLPTEGTPSSSRRSNTDQYEGACDVGFRVVRLCREPEEPGHKEGHF